MDFRVIRKSGFHFPQAVYVVSRFVNFAVLLCEAILLTAEVGSHCNALTLVVTSLWSLSYTLIGLLHLVRTRAIYLDRPWITRAFGAMWLISSGTSVAVSPFLFEEGIIGTGLCTHTNVNSVLIQITMGLNTFQGTCIALATSSGLVLSPADVYPMRQLGFLERLKFAVVAKNVPTFSKALLRHGQRYYL
ncbi:hypothetical protein PQX77_009481 [Marasmius sp. AFHP31]|nr:hypothetical protein PQX77_009481 [Marasmius sp. AFHP31]